MGTESLGLCSALFRAACGPNLEAGGPTELDDLADCGIRCKAAECLPELLLGETRMGVTAEEGV